MIESTKPYWFKPARFWKWFAAYYPVTWQGWVVSALAILFFIKIFIFIDSRSNSASDTLVGIAPWFIAIGLAFDMMCFRKGEYPSWWTPLEKRKAQSENSSRKIT